MNEKIKGWVEYNQDIIIINIILTIKVLIFSLIYGSAQNLFWLATTTFAIVFVLSSWSMFLPSLLRQSALLLLDVSISVLLIADSVFMRIFNRVVPMLAFYLIDQLSETSDSIITLISLRDFLFVLDLIFIVPFLAYVFSKQQKQKVKLRINLAQAALILLICSVFIFYKADKIPTTDGTKVISDIHLNGTFLNYMGVLNFHIADLYTSFKARKSTTLSTDELLTLKAWNTSHHSTKNDFQGAALGKNLIIIQMESLQNFLINRSINGQEVTPNLNKLVKSSMYFDNYFVQVSQGNTSDAEFMTFNSLYPPSIGASLLMYPNHNYISLPILLKDRGYNTFAIHGGTPSFWGRDVAFPVMGIDSFISKNELKEGNVIGMGLSDNEVFTQAVPIIEQAKKPFMSMIITLSGHHPYVLPESERELSIPVGEYSQIFSDYLQSQHYADKEIGMFLDILEKDGILDNSLLVIYGDHFGIGWSDEDIQRFLSISEPLTEYKKMELKKVPLFIRLPKGKNAGVFHQSGGQIDLMPTIANLLGIEKRKMVYFGQDLLNEKDGLTIFRYYATDGSFATNEFMYFGSADGVFEHGRAYNRITGQEIEVELLREKYNEAKKQLSLSDLLLERNAIPDLVSEE